MPAGRPKHLVLVAARSFAEKLATPAVITDERGTLVYYNDAAGAALGQSFAEAGEMPSAEWTRLYNLRSADGSPMPLEEMPAGIALLKQRPSHGELMLRANDGTDKVIAVTGVPLFARVGEPVGIMVIFWPEGEPEGEEVPPSGEGG